MYCVIHLNNLTDRNNFENIFKTFFANSTDNMQQHIQINIQEICVYELENELLFHDN